MSLRGAAGQFSKYPAEIGLVSKAHLAGITCALANEWFPDSPNGMRRYFDGVIETAGLSNTAGFNDDMRAFCSIPARHDVWRRLSADWVAGQVRRGLVELGEAAMLMTDLAVGLASRTYRL